MADNVVPYEKSFLEQQAPFPKSMGIAILRAPKNTPKFQSPPRAERCQRYEYPLFIASVLPHSPTSQGLRPYLRRDVACRVAIKKIPHRN